MKTLSLISVLFVIGCGGSNSHDNNTRAKIYSFKSWSEVPACTDKYAGYNILIEDEYLAMYACNSGSWIAKDQ